MIEMLPEDRGMKSPEDDDGDNTYKVDEADIGNDEMTSYES